MTTPMTSPSLLNRLLDHKDADAWATFDSIYRPALDRLLTNWGLQTADRQEVIQETFAAVSKSLAGYRPQAENGSFRGWIAKITRNKMVDLLKAKQRLPQTAGGSDFQVWLAQCPDEGQVVEGIHALSRWDLESRRAVFAWAAREVQTKVQSKTWLAFQGTAIEGKSAKDVAHELGASVGWVYVSRSRVLTKLRETVQATGEFEAFAMTPGPDVPNRVGEDDEV